MGEHAASFVAECYWPDVREEEVRTLDQRIAASLSEDVRYLGSVLIREDEVVLFHFEGTADAIRRVAERAQVPYERLLAANVSLAEERTQGAQGPQGPSGSSQAYSDSNLEGLTQLSPNSTTITKLTLPAGDYVVWATGSVVKYGTVPTTGSDNDVKCVLDDPDDNAVTASEAQAFYDDAVPYMLVGTLSLPTSGTITVDCTTLTGSVVSAVDFNSLVATKVDAVN
jgi:hypothetical protein